MPTEDWADEHGQREMTLKVIPCPSCRNPLPVRFHPCGDDGDHFHIALVCLCGADWGSPVPYYLIDGEYHVHR